MNLPAILYNDARIWPDAPSQYEICGNLVPGGMALTTMGVVYSIALSATAIISNGKCIPIKAVLDSEGQGDEQINQY